MQQTLIVETPELEEGEFAMLPERVASLNKTLERLGKKTIKKGGTPATLEVIREVSSNLREDLEQLVRVCIVKVNGTLPKEYGYRLVASLEHLPTGNIIRKAPEFHEWDMTDFRNVENTCQHCGTKRSRKNTCILIKDDGSTIQVGHNCLADFIRKEDVESLASYFTALELVSKEELKPSREHLEWSLDYVLAVASREISRYGYVKSDENRPTKFILMRSMEPPTRDTIKDWEDAQPTKSDLIAVPLIKEYVKNLEVNGSDYVHNIQTAFAMDGVNTRRLGLVASAVASYYREIGNNRARTALNEYFGEIGKRYELSLTLRKRFGYETKYGNMEVHIFNDEEGRTFVWKTNPTDFDVGDQVKGKGTVKEHEDYRDTKQTKLSRCKFLLKD